MALTTTTLAAACTNKDKSITVASATGFAAGLYVLIEREVARISKEYVSGTLIPLDQRGIDGAQVAHVSSAPVTVFGLNTDFSNPVPGGAGGNVFPAAPGRDTAYYSAAGAITLPTPGRDMLAILIGTGALAMTLANPTKDMDGCRLLVVGNGKAAHTITYAAGLGNGGSLLDVGTAAAGNQCAVEFVAANGFWVHIGLPSATGAANAFIWA